MFTLYCNREWEYLNADIKVRKTSHYIRLFLHITEVIKFPVTVCDSGVEAETNVLGTLSAQLFVFAVF